MGNYARDQIASDNQDCVGVYEELLKTVEQGRMRGDGPLSVAPVFFHDLLRILTGFVLRRNEVAGSFAPSDAGSAMPQYRFPYIGYRDLKGDGICLDKDFTLQARRRSRKRRLVEALARLGRPFRAPTRKSVLIGAPGVHFSQLWRGLAARGYTVSFASPRMVRFQDLTSQLGEVLRTVEVIFSRLGIDADPRGLQEVIRRHILGRAILGSEDRLEADLVVTGTLMGLEDRANAAKARSQGLPVVSVAHGEQFGAYDEPHIGYGELTFASSFVGYGHDEAIGLDDLAYGKSLLDQPEYVAADSDLARTVFTQPEVTRLADLVSPKIMYVPTQLSGKQRWGPFRDIPDAYYVAWHRTILEAFPQAILKLHPKAVVDPRAYGLTGGSVLGGRLEDCLDHADVFVCDVVSSAFALAAATPKPVIYCNIGFRRLSERGERAIRDRCIWIDADPVTASPDEIVAQVQEQAQDLKQNWFTPCFSLANSAQPASRVGVVTKSITSLA